MSTILTDMGPKVADRWLSEPVESGPQAGFGVYLHVPFCAHRCGYCDFATSDRHAHLMSRYVAALRDEIERWADHPSPSTVPCAPGSGGWNSVRTEPGEKGAWPEVTSVFVGGGTPTLLPAEDLAGIVALVREHFTLAADAEITVEANPETVDAAYVEVLVDAGVNRMSLGAQSFATHVLATLERRHDPDTVPRAVAAARAGGIGNLNLDLIYGTPGETTGDWERSLEEVLALGVDHVSAYALTVHDNTALGRDVARGRLPAPDPDVQRDRFEAARSILGSAGFEHYELSNWARGASRRSRHNVLYWRHGDYLGLGVGAHGHLDGRRWWNHRSIERWLGLAEAGALQRDEPRGARGGVRSDRRLPAAGEETLTAAERAGRVVPAAGDETLTAAERAEERLLLGLRLRDGLHPRDVPPLAEAQIQSAADLGLLQLSCGRFQATDDGWFLLDDLVQRLIA